MPRQARKKCESGVYHVMMRGINRQDIFEDEEDTQKLLDLFLKSHSCFPPSLKNHRRCLLS